jgi:hypothetical protein
MDELRLESLGIQGFRAFRQLELPRLARVNLFVGKNNVGKTSLLEALRIYGTEGEPATIVEILRSRDELGNHLPRSSAGPSGSSLEWAVEQLFNRERLSSDSPFFRIASTGERAVEVGLDWRVVQRDNSHDPDFPFMISDPIAASLPQPVLMVKGGALPQIQIPLDRLESIYGKRRGTQPCIWVSAYGLNPSEIGEFWDAITLTDLEEHVLNALRIIAPDVERLSFVGESHEYSNRSAVVKLPRLKRPVPMRSMGDGMNRLLGLALSLANAQDGMVMIDEVENGIHYSVQVDTWRLIFQIAQHLNVQVFATTHSWDCIEAFQQIANADPAVEGMLHRLERRKDGGIRVVDISEEDLAIATRNEIEIR